MQNLIFEKKATRNLDLSRKESIGLATPGLPQNISIKSHSKDLAPLQKV